MNTTSEKMTIISQKRDIKEKAKQIRKSNFIPAVVYSHGETEHIKLEEKKMLQLLQDGISESTVFNLKINDKEEQVFIKDYQLHPVTGKLLHLDFFKITQGEKIKTHIPIKSVGNPESLKMGGVLEIILHDLLIKAYSQDLQEVLEVDISYLEIGDALHVRDIKLDSEIEVLTDPNLIICQISQTRKLSVTATTTSSEEENTEKQEIKES